MVAQDIMLGLLVAAIPATIAWMVRVERFITATRDLPRKVDRLERLALRILMKVDPHAAQEELRHYGGRRDIEVN